MSEPDSDEAVAWMISLNTLVLIVPKGPKVVPFWDYLINSKYEPPKGTTLGPLGSLVGATMQESIGTALDPRGRRVFLLKKLPNIGAFLITYTILNFGGSLLGL